MNNCPESNKEIIAEPAIIHPKHPKKARSALKPPLNTVPAGTPPTKSKPATVDKKSVNL